VFIWDDVRCHELQDVLTCSLVGEGVASGGRSSLSKGSKDRAPRFEGSGTAIRPDRQRSVCPAGLCIGLNRNQLLSLHEAARTDLAKSKELITQTIQGLVLETNKKEKEK